MLSMPHRRYRFHINGIVQGVGFRPFVYRLARELNLAGFVNNTSEGVLIEAQGPLENLDTFRRRLREEAPPLSRIVDFALKEIPPSHDDGFSIIESDDNASASTLIAPDMSVCADCLRELFDPADRRYRYPFINCTNCGPRFTITAGIPYDRPKTSMRVFPMCPDCEREYHDPGNRRFHAQPNACPVCGPKVELRDRNGDMIATDDPVQSAVDLLKAGNIVAIRGLGGFHLAVDAFNDAAVSELRRRKGRAEKPFAMMAPDIETIERFCYVEEEEKALLTAPTRPIVLLRARAETPVAPSVAPGNAYLGFMLPYTPLHYLLVRERFDALVMTSGNYSEEPIAIGNAEGLERLRPLADFFLLHDREILQRCDDSVARVVGGKTRLLRRSRGFVPVPVFVEGEFKTPVLACGGELKSAIALTRGNAVFLSQHIGDLDNPAAFKFYQHSIGYLKDILQIEPEIIAHDLHPEYLSTKWATEQGLPLVGVQHHHAHLVSVQAENGVSGKTIGIILDGTGYGTDGTIWGGEVLVGDAREFTRFAWLEPVPMPGGEAAVREPWRMAVSYLYASFGAGIEALRIPVIERHRGELPVMLRMIDRGVNSPVSSGCGRLFDAVSSILGIREVANYEAQPAIELEMSVDESVRAVYENALPERGAHGSFSVLPLVESVVGDLRSNVPLSRIAAMFHLTLAEIFVRLAKSAREATGLNKVALSGGVFQNVFFFNFIVTRLQGEGFEVLTHSVVPANDGGLALGQAVIAGIHAAGAGK